MTYRADVDGLRAVAVVSVFLFHLKEAWMPGGFVGVDVFFVISGYLITSILMHDLRQGEFRLGTFYQRRIARLFPVMLTVITAVLLGAAVLYEAQDFASAGTSSVAALLFLANVKFFFQGDYFQISADAQPLLHFWSLSVEEQYYLFYPLLLLALARLNATIIASVILAISLVSFAACAALSFFRPDAAFYLLPFRAWELGLGATTAFAAQGNWGPLPRRMRPILGAAGLAAVIASVTSFDEAMVFPGFSAALPVLGTAALLLAGHGGTYPGQALLAWKPMVAVGKVSYTLYLWHWPVFSFTDYALFAAPEEMRLALKLAVTAALTVGTYYLIENPARRSLNRPVRRNLVFGGFAASLALMVPLGLKIRIDNYINASVERVAQGGIVYPLPEATQRILLIGDSNGSMYARMLRELSRDLGYTLVVASVSASDPLPSPKGPDSALWAANQALTEALEPEVVVLATAWASQLSEERAKLDLALDRLSPHTDRIIILNQPPVLPAQASRAEIRAGARPPFVEAPVRSVAREEINAYLESFGSDKITVVDIASLFTDPEGHVRFTDARGRQLYHDATHLSGYGAELVRSRIERAISMTRACPACR